MKIEHLLYLIVSYLHDLHITEKNFNYIYKKNPFFLIFQLNTPNGGWRKKTNHYVEGGDFGNREDKINEILRRMV